MKALDQIKLSSLMRATGGRPEVVVGVIDGPVDLSHPAFQGVHIRATRGARAVSCRVADSVACGHGTFIAGILATRRGLAAPAICPHCDLVLRPIFHEERQNALGIPNSDPRELAAAIRETIDAGGTAGQRLALQVPEESPVAEPETRAIRGRRLREREDAWWEREDAWCRSHFEDLNRYAGQWVVVEGEGVLVHGKRSRPLGGGGSATGDIRPDQAQLSHESYHRTSVGRRRRH